MDIESMYGPSAVDDAVSGSAILNGRGAVAVLGDSLAGPFAIPEGGSGVSRKRLSLDGSDTDQDLIVSIVRVEFYAAEFRADQPLQTRGGG